jgi:hypothetical protein
MVSKLVLLGRRECNVFENRKLRRTFAPERDRKRVTGEWRILHNKEVHNLYFSPHIVERKNQGRWAGLKEFIEDLVNM